jgi:hypothetical protein
LFRFIVHILWENKIIMQERFVASAWSNRITIDEIAESITFSSRWL